MLYGCLPAKTDLRDYKLCSSNVSVEYPEEFTVCKELPKVKNQGNVNSCCAHATSSILEYHANSHFCLSTDFIYGIQKKLFNQCQMGMYLADACKIAIKYGDPLDQDCHGNHEIPYCYDIAETTLCDSNAMMRGYNFRIINYYLCSTDNDIKYALMNYGPVLGAIYWREHYTFDRDVIHFDTQSQGGGHAIMIYGWNEDGWLIQNSWGDEFANEGRFVLPFEYGFQEARAIVDFDNSSDIVLQKPCTNEFKSHLYKVANVFVNLYQRIKNKFSHRN